MFARLPMLVTHTTNPEGHRRVYLGGKSSLECWIEPLADGVGWSFHLETALGCYPLPEETRQAWANEVLITLAKQLEVSTTGLADVAFDRIAALHTGNPVDYRRVAVPRRQRVEHGFMASAPLTTTSRRSALGSVDIDQRRDGYRNES